MADGTRDAATELDALMDERGWAETDDSKSWTTFQWMREATLEIKRLHAEVESLQRVCQGRITLPEPTRTPDAASVLVLAGTKEQANFYARKLGLSPNQWRYPTAKTTRGRMEPVVYVVGTYYERDDLDEVLAALAPCRPTYLNEAGTERDMP